MRRRAYETSGGIILIMGRSRVRGYIVDALMRLLRERRYQDISVSELVQAAGVCRASFYRNFACKEDVVDEYFRRTFGALQIGNPMERDTVSEVMTLTFRAIEARRDEFMLLRENGLLDRIDPVMYRATLWQIGRLGVFNNRYQPHFFTGASSALVKAWIANGCEESPEEMVALFEGSLRGYLDFS